MDELNNFTKWESPLKGSEDGLGPAITCMKLQSLLQKYIGVCCFTKHLLCKKCSFPKLNPVMLSSYSDQQRGIIIEYESNQPNFLKKIVYQHKYKHFYYQKILKNINFHPELKLTDINDTIIEPLQFKFFECNYQHEHRIFEKPNQLLSINNFGLKISRIYFGT